MNEKNDNPWSEEEITLLVQLIPENTYAEIAILFRARGFERSTKAISRKAEKLGLKRKTVFNFKPVDTEPFVEAPTPRPYEEPVLEESPMFPVIDILCGSVVAEENRKQKQKEDTWNQILDLKTEYMNMFSHQMTGLMPPEEATRKILCLSDFHIPFEREDLIMGIIDRHLDADVLVLNGDMLDMHAVSTWPKERQVVLRKEYEIAMHYLQYFSEKFKHIVLVRGNHEERLNRYFHSNIESCVSFLVNKDVLSRLRNGEMYDEKGNVTMLEKFTNIHYDMSDEPWFVKIGKTVFAHPKTFYSVEGKTAVETWRYFMQREDIDCVVCAHTHQVAKVFTRGKLCIEQGCLCAPLDYEKQGKLRFKPMSLGYCVIYQDKEGNCDFNRSEVCFLGTQQPLKASIEDELDFED